MAASNAKNTNDNSEDAKNDNDSNKDNANKNASNENKNASNEGKNNSNEGKNNSNKNADKNSNNSSNSNKNSASNANANANANTNSNEAAAADPNRYVSTYVASNAQGGQSAGGEIKWLTASTTAATMAKQVQASWTSSKTAVLVPASEGSLLLCASALAGALNCPVLAVDFDGLDETTGDTLAQLGVRHVYAVGLDDDLESQVRDQLRDRSGIASGNMVNMCGASHADTAVRVAEYGYSHNLWKLGGVSVASDTDGDAPASAAAAYTLAQPVLLTGEDGQLPSSIFLADKDVFHTGTFSFMTLVSSPGKFILRTINVLGTDGAVSSQALKPFVFVCHSSSGGMRTAHYTGVDFRSIASSAYILATGGQEASWSNALITGTGGVSSATACLMAARTGAAFACVGNDNAADIGNAIAATGVNTVTATGDDSLAATIPIHTIRAKMDMYSVEYVNAGISIDAMANKEVDDNNSISGAAKVSKDEILAAMDPGAASRGTTGYFQFAKLGQGYSGAVSAAQLDSYIDSIAGSYEASYGARSVLRGSGAYFIEAAKKYNVNEVYLLAHAILESACGCSNLARGTSSGGAHNLFGIAAYDSNPSNGGSYASSQGWNTVQGAVEGGAQWISEHYIRAGQDTLYTMRWNVPSANHQYASGTSWATGIAKLMSNCYAHNGIALERTGLDFKIVVYN